MSIPRQKDFSSKAAYYEALGRYFEDHFLKAGLAFKNKTTIDKVDPTQLEMGIKVEYEHTSSKEIAMRIALDHLTEIKDYYTRLEEMEREAGT